MSSTFPPVTAVGAGEFVHPRAPIGRCADERRPGIGGVAEPDHVTSHRIIPLSEHAGFEKRCFSVRPCGGSIANCSGSAAIRDRPPSRYGGTELVVATLTNELVRRANDVTLF